MYKLPCLRYLVMIAQTTKTSIKLMDILWSSDHTLRTPDVCVCIYIHIYVCHIHITHTHQQEKDRVYEHRCWYKWVGEVIGVCGKHWTLEVVRQVEK